MIMIGILGNISDDDVPAYDHDGALQLCRHGADCCCGHAPPALTTRTAWFVSCCQQPVSVELDYRDFDSGEEERARSAQHAYDGRPQPLITGQQLFTFVR